MLVVEISDMFFKSYGKVSILFIISSFIWKILYADEKNFRIYFSGLCSTRL